MRRIVVFNYNSKFIKDIQRTIQVYNSLFPKNTFLLDIYNASEVMLESSVGPADIIIHSGGVGTPVKEDVEDTLKIYICYSHQWKAKKCGGEVIRLKSFITGIHYIDVLEDDEILGEKGSIPIMKYHEFAVVKPPPFSTVLAKSRAISICGEKIDIIEALRYRDGSISIQGHPEEGTAAHIYYNFLSLKGVFSPV